MLRGKIYKHLDIIWNEYERMMKISEYFATPSKRLISSLTFISKKRHMYFLKDYGYQGYWLDKAERVAKALKDQDPILIEKKRAERAAKKLTKTQNESITI